MVVPWPTGRQKRLDTTPWHVELMFGVMGNVVGSRSLVAPHLFCVANWEYVEIDVWVFSSRKDSLRSAPAGSGLPGCGRSAGLELGAEPHRRFPVRCRARRLVSLCLSSPFALRTRTQRYICGCSEPLG